MYSPLVAAPPLLPENIGAYLHKAAIAYQLPAGSYEPFLKSWFEDHGQPEPWAVSGDFNGDSIADWAGLLRNAEGHLDLVIVYSVDGALSHRVLRSLGIDDDEIYFGVELESPGQKRGFPLDDGPRPIITTLHPSIHFIYYEKSSVLYYWEDDSFQEIWTSD